MTPYFFKVDTRPYCFYRDDELDNYSNIHFIDGIDHEFYEYQANLHFGELNSKNNQRAALSLRLILHQALETLFSLMFATLQAPYCINAWLIKYNANDLRSLIKKIQSNKLQFSDIVFPLRTINFQSLSSIIHNYSNVNREKVNETSKLFADFWFKMSKYYINDLNNHEYNSIKHGLRLRSGGFNISIGTEHVYGVPPPSDEFKKLGGSEFGSTFQINKTIIGKPKIKNEPNFTTVKISKNWNPESLAYSLILISLSINNLKSFLKITNGQRPSEVQFKRPQDSKFFNKPWENLPNLDNLIFNKNKDLSNYYRYTSEEIKEHINKVFMAYAFYYFRS